MKKGSLKGLSSVSLILFSCSLHNVLFYVVQADKNKSVGQAGIKLICPTFASDKWTCPPLSPTPFLCESTCTHMDAGLQDRIYSLWSMRNTLKQEWLFESSALPSIAFSRVPDFQNKHLNFSIFSWSVFMNTYMPYQIIKG